MPPDDFGGAAERAFCRSLLAAAIAPAFPSFNISPTLIPASSVTTYTHRIPAISDVGVQFLDRARQNWFLVGSDLAKLRLID